MLQSYVSYYCMIRDELCKFVSLSVENLICRMINATLVSVEINKS